jgi:hypothetical protein
VTGRKREIKRETDRERKGERGIDRVSERERDKERQRERDKEREREGERERESITFSGSVEVFLCGEEIVLHVESGDGCGVEGGTVQVEARVGQELV